MKLLQKLRYYLLCFRIRDVTDTRCYIPTLCNYDYQNTTKLRYLHLKILF